MQSDSKSSKTDTFQAPTNYEPHVHTSSEKKNARHGYGQVGVFRIKM